MEMKVHQEQGLDSRLVHRYEGRVQMSRAESYQENAQRHKLVLVPASKKFDGHFPAATN